MVVIWEMYMFSLDPRLVQDSLSLGDFPLCRLLLMNDARYPWFILVPRRESITEPFQLDAADQIRLWSEVSLLAERLKHAFDADKMNVAALGNVVSQLHVHVIARRVGDAAWPAPVWGSKSVPYAAEQIASVMQRLQDVLSDDFVFLSENHAAG